MFKWHDLMKAKKNMRSISHELETLSREHDNLYRRDLERHREKLLEQCSESIIKIEQEYSEMMKNIISHRKSLETKAIFLRRHHDKKAF